MNRTPRPTSRRLALCAATVVGVLGMAGSAAADTAPDSVRAASGRLMVIDDTVPEDGLVDIMPVDPAQSNAEQDALAEYLTTRGIAFTIITDGDFRWVEIDWEDTAAQTAVEDFYWERYPMPQEVIDQINGENDALARYLRDRGIEVTVTTDRHGITSLEWDWEDPAAQTAVEDFYWELYPMPQEVIDQINADAETLAEFLRGKGLEATVVVDRHGLATVEYDWEDPAVQAALDEYWGQFMPEPLPLPLDGDVVLAAAGSAVALAAK